MIEVEAKVRISNPSLIRERARKLGEYLGKQGKIDDYYSLENNGYPKKSLRIRKLNGTYQINFKQRLKSKSKVDSKNEVEFKASNIKDFLALIHEFGFKKWIRKEKHSEIYEIKNNLHIELNDVRGLGWFAEVECLVSNQSEVENARKEVLKAIKQLGLNKKNIVKSGYTKMLWDKRH